MCNVYIMIFLHRAKMAQFRDVVYIWFIGLFITNYFLRNSRIICDNVAVIVIEEMFLFPIYTLS